MQAAYPEFRSRQAELWAIAYIDTSLALTISQLVNAGYPVLADVDHAVADSYGVYNLLGDRLAAPSVFIVDPAGRMAWSYIGQSTTDRPSPADILSHLPPNSGG